MRAGNLREAANVFGEEIGERLLQVAGKLHRIYSVSYDDALSELIVGIFEALEKEPDHLSNTPSYVVQGAAYAAQTAFGGKGYGEGAYIHKTYGVVELDAEEADDEGGAPLIETLQAEGFRDLAGYVTKKIAIESLDAVDRRLLGGYALGLAKREIAQELGITPSQLYRRYRGLREKLAAAVGNEPTGGQVRVYAG